MNQAATTKPLMRAEQIENSINRKQSDALAVSQQMGGVQFRNMGEVLEFSKLLAVSGAAVPKHCRNEPGVCLAVVTQAIEWRMSPYAVANKSYLVNDRIGYESQLFHAVIEQRAPIVGRLRHSFSGEGSRRRCKVWAYVKGEDEPLVYESPEFVTIQPKNSPLWKTKPDLQLYYNTSRDWARVYFPDVILGVYAEDELFDAIDVGPKQPARLPAAGSRVEAVRQRLTEQQEPTEPLKGEIVTDLPTASEEPPADESPETEPPHDEPEPAADETPEPPAMPAWQKAYVHALHASKTPEDARDAWSKHVESRNDLSEDEFNAATELCDMKLVELEKTAERKAKKKPAKGELFDGDEPTGASTYPPGA